MCHRNFTTKEKAVFSQFGLLGALASASITAGYSAVTLLEDLKLIHRPTAAVLWEGTVEGKVQGEGYTDAAGDMVYRDAADSLRKATEQLIAELSKVQPQPNSELATHAD